MFICNNHFFFRLQLVNMHLFQIQVFWLFLNVYLVNTKSNNVGETARLGQFPYQIALEKRYSKNKYTFVCGGALIQTNYVLTAAQCVSSGFLRVRAGNLKLNEEEDVGEIVGVDKAFIHADYNSTRNINDIAILQLNSNFNISENIKPIKLSKNFKFKKNEKGVVSGWVPIKKTVSNRNEQNVQNSLEYVKVEISSFKECQEILRDSLENESSFHFDKNMMCSIYKNNEICNGYSGNPLVHKKKLIGLVSWTIVPCGKKKQPYVFTRVDKYFDWIKEHLKNDDK